MKKIRFDKNTILIILLIIVFLLLFATYIFSLVKKDHLRRNGDKESSEEKEILKAEEDPMYNKYCQGEVKYITNNKLKKGGLGYTQDIVITITNNSANTYTSWTIKIPSNNVTIEDIKDASYYYSNGSAYITSLGSFDKLVPGDSVVIDATISTPKSNLDETFKYMVLTDCSKKSSNTISKGNAKLSLGELEVELTPEVVFEQSKDNEITYALYLNNNNTSAVKNPRLVISLDQGTFVSLSTFTITENTDAKTINAIDMNDVDSMINRGYKSQKYTLVLKNVPDNYIPDIVAAGTKID